MLQSQCRKLEAQNYNLSLTAEQLSHSMGVRVERGGTRRRSCTSSLWVQGKHTGWEEPGNVGGNNETLTGETHIWLNRNSFECLFAKQVKLKPQIYNICVCVCVCVIAPVLRVECC